MGSVGDGTVIRTTPDDNAPLNLILTDEKTTSNSETNSKSSPLDLKFSKLVQDTLEKWHIEGVAVAVVDGDETWSEVCAYLHDSFCTTGLRYKRATELRLCPIPQSDPKHYSLPQVQQSRSQLQLPLFWWMITKSVQTLNGQRL